jgi:hypothetical protein
VRGTLAATVFVFVSILAAPPVLAAAPNLLRSPQSYSTATGPHHFVVVGSYTTKRAALMALSRLRASHTATPLAIFPPYSSSGYWAIVTASYIPLDVAREAARAARRQRVARDAFVLTRPSSRSLEGDYRPIPESLPAPPSTTRATAPPGRVLADANRIVSVGRYPTLREAESRALRLMAEFHALEPVILRAASGYAVTLAAFSGEKQAAEAANYAARLGIPASDIQIETLAPAVAS